MDSPIKIDPGICHGTPCFSGTRVFASTLFDHLAYGYTIDEMLEQYPSVSREQVLAVLETAAQDAVGQASAVYGRANPVLSRSS